MVGERAERCCSGQEREQEKRGQETDSFIIKKSDLFNTLAGIKKQI